MPIAMAAMMPPLSCMPGWGPKIYTRTGSKNKQKNPPNFLLRSYLGYLMKLMHSDKKKKMPKMLTLVILLQINLYIISVFVFL